MLPSMFGIGGSEILVILVVALIFLGPEKLPDAATKISKGIRELRRQTREVQQTIENDTEFGGAIRDLKSALRGDEIRPKVRAAFAPLTDAAKEVADAARLDPAKPSNPTDPKPEDGAKPAAVPPDAKALADAKDAAAIAAEHALLAAKYAENLEREHAAAAAAAAPGLTLPPSAGEHADPDARPPTAEDDAELAKLIRPAAGTVAHGTTPKSADDHG